MMDKISFCDADELYILGDLVDRGAESAEMLSWAIEKASDNVHFLIGNHEIMMRDALDKERPFLQRYRAGKLWRANKGRKTLKALKRQLGDEWIEEKLVPWLNDLDTHFWVEVDGRDFLLVHAGLSIPAMKAEAAGKSFRHMVALHQPGIMNWIFPPQSPKMLDLDHGIGRQNEDELVWSRSEWLTRPADLPFDVVHGHSVISERTLHKISDAGGEPDAWEPGKILHYFGNRHDIDCGCAAGRAPYALGCMRLDDMAEFYVPLKD